MASLRSLPVPDVTELNGAEGRAAVRAATGTPMTPPQAPGGSPEAQAFRGARAAPDWPKTPGTGPGGASPAQRLGSAAARAARAARAAAPIAKLGGAAGLVSNFNDYKIDDPEVDSTAAGTIKALQAGDFKGARASLGKGFLETAMDVGSSLANTADYVVPGKAPVSSAYNRMLRDTFGNQLIDNSGTPVLPPTAPAAAVAAPAAAVPAPSVRGFGGRTTMDAAADPRRLDMDPSRMSAGPARDFTKELAGLPGQMPQGMREGVVIKTKDAQGRTVYSGSNVKEGAQMVDGLGRATDRQMPSVGVYPGMDAGTRERALAGSAPVQAGYTPGATPGGMVGIQGTSLAQDLRARGDAAGPNDMTRTERIARAQMANQRQIAGMEDATRRYTADQNADVTLRGQDLSANVTTRGQDVAAGTARMQGRVQQMQNDRQYQMEAQKFGHEQAKTAFTQRAEADENLTKKLTTFNTRTVDGKAVVDNEAVAAHKQAVSAFLSAQIADAERSGRPDLAEQLRSKGAAAISEQRLQQIVSQLQSKKINAENSSWWNPLKGTRIDSANPADYDIVGVERNTLAPDMALLRGGGKTPLGALNYDQGNAFLNVTNAPTTRFDNIKQERGVR